jgi:hypothetical protein
MRHGRLSGLQGRVAGEGRASCLGLRFGVDRLLGPRLWGRVGLRSATSGFSANLGVRGLNR